MGHFSQFCQCSASIEYVLFCPANSIELAIISANVEPILLADTEENCLKVGNILPMLSMFNVKLNRYEKWGRLLNVK